MESRTYVKDAHGRIIGSIETKPNGDKILRSDSGKMNGFYYKQQDVTKNDSGKILYKGDCLILLLK